MEISYVIHAFMLNRPHPEIPPALHTESCATRKHESIGSFCGLKAVYGQQRRILEKSELCRGNIKRRCLDALPSLVGIDVCKVGIEFINASKLADLPIGIDVENE